jgi:hypothetical protein
VGEEERPFDGAWDRLGAFLGMFAVALTLGSWVPSLSLQLGNDHFGRILGRMALHADNLVADGWGGSGWATAWTPYSSARYAHHPPFAQVLNSTLGWLADGTTPALLRSVGIVFGVGTVALAYLAVRRLTGSRWAGGVAALGLSLSGFFWTFGRIGGGLTVFFAFLVVWARRQQLGEWGLVGLAALGVVAGVTSWMAATVVGFVVLRGLFDAKSRKAATVGAAGLAAGALLTVWWIAGSAGFGALFQHLEAREAAISYSAVEWFRRQVDFFLRFESWFVALVIIAGSIASIIRRSLRIALLPLVGVVVLFAMGFRQNAWIHEYWNWGLSYAFAIALAVLGLFVERRFPRLSHRGAVWIAGVAVVFSLGLTTTRFQGAVYDSQFLASSAAGELVARAAYPEDQTVAWHLGSIPTPRWLAWYTGLSPRSLDVDQLDRAGGSDLVIVRRHWADRITAEPTDRVGGYDLFRVDQLSEWLTTPSD